MYEKKQWLARVLAGGLLGVCGYVLLSFLAQPGGLFSGSLKFAFTFCFDSRVPEALGAVLGAGLWFAFGAEIAAATLPFADEGRSLLLCSLLHFVLMSLTLSAWVLLNFGPYDLITFLVPFVLVYFLIWLGRWVGWYAEVAQIRAKLGLAPGPSPLRWKETLPYLPFLLLVCGLLPLAARWLDPIDFPVFSGLLVPYLLLPVAGFFSGLSLGKRQGFCPLYPLAAFLLYLPMVPLLFNGSALFHCFMVAVPALAGNLVGAGIKWQKGRQ